LVLLKDWHSLLSSPVHSHWYTRVLIITQVQLHQTCGLVERTVISMEVTAATLSAVGVGLMISPIRASPFPVLMALVVFQVTVGGNIVVVTGHKQEKLFGLHAVVLVDSGRYLMQL
jgi:hypothetical protein